MPRATASVIGMATHPVRPTLSRNHAITNAMAVEMTIRTDNSNFSDEKKPIGRPLSNSRFARGRFFED